MASAAKLHVTVQDYLGKSFRPDRDLVDGVFEERNLGELEHSEMQAALSRWFTRHEEAWKVSFLPEMRLQTGPTRFRVPDMVIVAADAPRERILTTPPLIVIEILSPEDRVGRYKERLSDYRRMGVKNIWVIDPMTLEGFDCSSGAWIPMDTFSVADSRIALPLRQLGISR